MVKYERKRSIDQLSSQYINHLDKYETNQMSFNDFLASLQSSGWPDAACLFAQIILSAFVILNIRKHHKKFPIKQLSPICTIAALLSFLLINVLSVIGRQIQQANGYYSYTLPYQASDVACGQCRINKSNALLFIGLVYSALRDFPLVIFALKTVRVSICFMDMEKRQLPKKLISIFKSQWRITGISFLYVLVLFIVNLLDLLITQNGITQYSARLTFEFLCPKQSGVFDWITTTLRYVLLAVSYTLSIKSYKQLDFKRFIFIIFLLSNTQVIIRAVLVFMQIEYQTYHEFYYHSLLLNLLGTLILLPYSAFNLNVNQPPAASLLQNFQAFINYIPGRDIIRCFALYKDDQERTSKYSECFDACLAIRKIKMEITLESALLAQRRSQINRLLGKSQVVQYIQTSKEIKKKIQEQTVQLSDIKRLQKQLIEFCENQLFKHWKKTESRDYIQKEFERNMVIDEKMKELGVEIGS